MRNCLGTKWQHDVTCVVLKHRRPNGALSANVVQEWLDGSLAPDFRCLNTTISSRIVEGNCVRELDVDSSITWETVVDILVPFQSLALPRRQLSVAVQHKLFIDHNPCGKFLSDAGVTGQVMSNSTFPRAKVKVLTM